MLTVLLRALHAQERLEGGLELLGVAGLAGLAALELLAQQPALGLELDEEGILGLVEPTKRQIYFVSNTQSYIEHSASHRHV